MRLSRDRLDPDDLTSPSASTDQKSARSQGFFDCASKRNGSGSPLDQLRLDHFRSWNSRKRHLLIHHVKENVMVKNKSKGPMKSEFQSITIPPR